VTLAEFLANVKRINKTAGRNRITTADRYLVTLAKCSGGLCPTDRARYQGTEFAKRVKEAAAIPVYKNDRMNFVSFSKDAADVQVEGRAAKFLSTFEGVYTSTKEDRDSDVLEAGGCTVDEKMPLLWQHDSTSPIGAHLGVVGQDKHKVLGKCGIADIPLGRDAAYLAELDCLRLSQGFRPTEFEPITAKSGGQEIVTGFHVLKYEMMEISLVSVPSNTDAILTAFHRNKLTSAQVKSMSKALDEHRQKFYRTGFGVPAMKLPAGRTVVGIKRITATGVKRKPKSRKDAAETEKALADACGGIVHSGDYGLCFYRPAQDEAMVEVWWTAGDADTPDQSNEEGTPYTSADDIKSLLGNVPGVASVEIGSEANPPYDEGWREVYPEVRDWTSGDADKPQPADAGATGDGSTQNSEPPAGDDTGKGGKGKTKGKKDGAPVAGSAEAVAMALADQVGPYLSQNGAAVEDGTEAVIQATFPDSVIVRVGGDADGTGATYYRLAFTTDGDGNPTLTGAPEEVELQTVVTDAPAADPAPGAPAPAGDGGAPPATDPASSGGGGSTDPNDPKRGKPAAKGAAGKRTVTKWVTKPKVKGKLGKKDTNLLTEAKEHLDDAMSRDGMPTVCKTLIRRASDCIGDVMKSEGAGQDADNGNGTPGQGAQPALLSEGEERNLWNLALKMVTNPRMTKTALAATLSELAEKLEAADVAKWIAAAAK